MYRIFRKTNLKSDEQMSNLHEEKFINQSRISDCTQVLTPGKLGKTATTNENSSAFVLQMLLL